MVSLKIGWYPDTDTLFLFPRTLNDPRQISAFILQQLWQSLLKTTCVTPKPKDDAPGKDELEEYLAMPCEDPDEIDLLKWWQKQQA